MLIDLESRSDPPWWMKPHVLSLALMIPLLTAAWLAPVEFHWEIRRAIKFLNLNYYVLGLAGVLALASGAFLTANATPRLEGLAIAYVEAAPTLRRLLKMASWGLFTVTVGAYLLWFAPVARDPSILTDIFAGRGEERAVRDTIGTIPGITTLVQAEVPYMTLIALRWVYLPTVPLSRLEKLACAIVLSLTMLRNFVWSERLSVIEFVMPLAVLLLRKPRYPLLTAFAPLFAAALLLTFFGISEYFRSWSYYQYEEESFIQFIITRILAYYIAALDNGAGLVRDFGGQTAPAMTADWFWRFPWEIGQTTLHKVLNLAVRDDYMNWLYWNATEEYNNPSGIFMPFVDFGAAGGLVYWFLFGLLTGLIFRSFAHGNFAGMLLYPSWFIGILEMPLEPYNLLNRYFPIMIITLALIFLVSIVAAQEVRSTPKRRLL